MGVELTALLPARRRCSGPVRPRFPDPPPCTEGSHRRSPPHEGMVVAGDGGLAALRADSLSLLGEPRDENPPFGVCLGPSKSTDKPVMSEKATVGRAERHDPLQGATSLSGP